MTRPTQRQDGLGIGLMWRSLAPAIVVVWLLTLVCLATLEIAGDGRHRAAEGLILGLAGVATAAITWVGWTLVVSPARRLRTRAALLAHRGDLNAAIVGADEYADLDRALGALSERLSSQHVTIEREQRTLRALIESLAEPTFVVDAEGAVALANAPAARFVQLGMDDLRGRNLRVLLTSSQLLGALSAAGEGRTWKGRVTIPTESGERTWEAYAGPFPLPDSEARGAILVLRDVTELADAVRVKTDFVANASHELRTPLAAIRGAVETLNSDAGRDEKIATRMREIILGHVTRLEDLVRDLLDLSRVESGDAPLRIEGLRLDLLKRTLLDEFEDLCAARAVRIVFDIPQSLEGWRTDPRMLVLSLRNLVENAAKFCHDDSEIRVVARLERRDDEIVRFEVRDRGLGIPLSQQQRVFERFYQVDPARQGYEGLSSLRQTKRGTGLGLAIVRHAVKALGGRVGIQSIYSQGTTVWFEVPYTLPADLRQEAIDLDDFEESERFIDEPDQIPPEPS